ncbi:hypothetical protein [Amycolatopsis saalfeldensis]|uniref:hypothetical protein n=1 Tax=Amycolatopsis saalfeldensis TaxID=394193 RepID=UPI001FE87E4B|nr:hypothetical protein [Amycolatopsis saalfeldensis]
MTALAWIALAWLGLASPSGTHPLFYFGLIFLGAGAFALLLSGIGALTSSRIAARQPLPNGVRTLLLAMWLCAIVVDIFGCLIVLAVSGGRGNTTPLSTTALVAVFVTAALTVACATVASFTLRRRLPRF